MKSKSLASAIFIDNLIAFACCRWANAITPMRLAGSALGVALVVFGPSCARADLVTYTATGQLNGAAVPLQGQFIVGQPFTYTFTLNTATPDSDPSPTHGKYYNGLISSSGSIGSYQFSTGLGDIDINTAVSWSRELSHHTYWVACYRGGGSRPPIDVGRFYP